MESQKQEEILTRFVGKKKLDKSPGAYTFSAVFEKRLFPGRNIRPSVWPLVLVSVLFVVVLVFYKRLGQIIIR
jgi:hypothetical protein